MRHTCHWPGCKVEIRTSLFCCRRHWFALPRPMRREIWRTYRRGQEETKNPTREYLAAAHAALDWARRQAR